jgi:photosystem II stability/assembly factor-like uncharacterized protein
MRTAACAAVLCAAMFAAGCDSNDELVVSHPRVLKGTVESSNLDRIVEREAVAFDFVSPRQGFVANAGGVILETRNGGSTWHRRGQVPMVSDLDFVSGRRGFAITQRNIVLATSTGGRSWFQLARLPHVRQERFSRLVFIDDRHGWAARGAGPLYLTRDGGHTWVPAPSPCNEFDRAVGPSFVDERDGYLVCGHQPGAGSQGKDLHVTSDGGATWKLRSSVGIGEVRRGPGAMPSGGYASSIAFDSRGVGFMTAVRGGIYRTDTGGSTWRPLFYSEDAADIVAPTPRRLYFALRAGLLRSDDGGQHWVRVFPEGFAEPQGPIVFFSNDRAIAFGAPEPLGTPHTVLATKNGGRTWFLRGEIPLRGLVEQVFRFGNVLLATDGQTLLRSQDQGKTWTRIRGKPERARGWFSFVSPRVGFFAAGTRRLLRTDDGGSHWRVVAKETRDLQGVVFASERDAFLVSYGPSPPDDGRKHPGRPPQRLLHSGDGGKSWSEVETPLRNIVGNRRARCRPLVALCEREMQSRKWLSLDSNPPNDRRWQALGSHPPTSHDRRRDDDIRLAARRLRRLAVERLPDDRRRRPHVARRLSALNNDLDPRLRAVVPAVARAPLRRAERPAAGGAKDDPPGPDESVRRSSHHDTRDSTAR